MAQCDRDVGADRPNSGPAVRPSARSVVAPADHLAGVGERAGVRGAGSDCREAARGRLDLTVPVRSPADRLAGVGERACVTAASADRRVGAWRGRRRHCPADRLALFGECAAATGVERAVVARGWLGLPVVVPSPAVDFARVGQRARVVGVVDHSRVARRCRVRRGQQPRLCGPAVCLARLCQRAGVWHGLDIWPLREVPRADADIDHRVAAGRRIGRDQPPAPPTPAHGLAGLGQRAGVHSIESRLRAD